jgi:hypothetical protein
MIYPFLVEVLKEPGIRLMGALAPLYVWVGLLFLLQLIWIVQEARRELP